MPELWWVDKSGWGRNDGSSWVGEPARGKYKQRNDDDDNDDDEDDDDDDDEDDDEGKSTEKVNRKNLTERGVPNFL